MKILVTNAISQERVDADFFGCTVIYCETGIGKVNAVLAVYELVVRYKPDLILNIGTAGSIKHEIGSVLVCGRFKDRDMEKCKELGVEYYHDFTEELAKNPLISSWDFQHLCNTGDSFITEKIHDDADVYDMENFAVATLCKQKQIPLVSVKYITDKIGENSIQDWENKLSSAKVILKDFLRKMNNKFVENRIQY